MKLSKDPLHTQFWQEQVEGSVLFFYYIFLFTAGIEYLMLCTTE